MAKVFLFSLIPLLLIIQGLVHTNAQPLFPSLLVFGDSAFDTGNNNFISSILSLNRADHPPYGKDFPTHKATGRFSNGKLIPDFLAKTLGLKDAVPAYLDPTLTVKDLSTGVSFASAGSGYDEETVVKTGAIPMSKQLEYFKEYIEKIKEGLGEKEAKKIVKNGIVVISAGTNDFVANYYDLPTRRVHFNVSGYQDFVLKRVQSFIEKLYELGCRKIIVGGVPPMGCLPIQMTAKFKNPKSRTCVEDQNSDALSYNQKLQNMLRRFQASLPSKDARLIYADVYQPFTDMIVSPHDYGFRVTDRGCCGTGYFEAGGLCGPLTPTCKNASEYMYWDSVHPSEAAYQHLHDSLLLQVGPQLINGNNMPISQLPTCNVNA